jgi:hypothetical protein
MSCRETSLQHRESPIADCVGRPHEASITRPMNCRAED